MSTPRKASDGTVKGFAFALGLATVLDLIATDENIFGVMDVNEEQVSDGAGLEDLSADDIEAVTGPAFDRLLGVFEHDYNDGQRYVLHYVSSRELYNIVKAAEAGKTGNPNAYRDFVLPPPRSSRAGNAGAVA